MLSSIKIISLRLCLNSFKSSQSFYEIANLRQVKDILQDLQWLYI